MSRLWKRFRFRVAAALAFASLVPVVLMGVLTLELARRSLEQAVVRRHEAVLDAFTSSLELYIAHQVAQLEQLARNPAVQTMDPIRQEPILNDFRTGRTLFEQLEVTAWRPVAASSAGTAAPLSGELAARAAREGRTVSAPRKGGRGQSFALPIRGFGELGPVVGVLTAHSELSGTGIQEILDAFPARRDRWMAVVDERGAILAQKGLGAGARTIELPPAPPGRDRVRTVEADNGPAVDLLSYSRLPSTGGWLVSGQPKEGAFHLVRTLRENMGAVFLVALFLVLAASVVLSKAISQPITALACGIAKLQAGVLTHRVELDSEDEIGMAGRAFNDLAQALQKQSLIASIWTELEKDRKP